MFFLPMWECNISLEGGTPHNFFFDFEFDCVFPSNVGMQYLSGGGNPLQFFFDFEFDCVFPSDVGMQYLSGGGNPSQFFFDFEFYCVFPSNVGTLVKILLLGMALGNIKYSKLTVPDTIKGFLLTTMFLFIL